nr:MAG TPA: hypothetical protein [Caudoviricetes sp.]
MYLKNSRASSSDICAGSSVPNTTVSCSLYSGCCISFAR